MSSNVTASDFRVKFTEEVRKVLDHGEVLLVTRHDKPLVAVVSMADYALLQALKEARTDGPATESVTPSA